MNTIRILAVDDHEMIMLGYKMTLERMVIDQKNIIVDTATSYEAGRDRIEGSANSFRYDILLLDIQLYPPNDNQPNGGEDLGKLARQCVPESKIIYMTSFSDNYRINTIMKTVDPEGFMVKTDIDGKTLQQAIRTVLTDPPYYSSKALNAIRSRMSDDLHLDEKDQKILYHLSIGTKTKDLEQHIRLSASSIENRKRQLKSLFHTEKENDLALISAARKRGFI